MKEETLNVGVLCGGRTSQRTYNNFIKMYNYAKINGYKDVNVRFIDPHVDKTIKILKDLLIQLDTRFIDQVNIEEYLENAIEELGGKYVRC